MVVVHLNAEAMPVRHYRQMRPEIFRAAAIPSWEATVAVRPISLGVVQPETAVVANQQAANLVAKLREKQGQGSNRAALQVNFPVNI
jgi:hypothetical protein